jgi:hypothetical protein
MVTIERKQCRNQMEVLEKEIASLQKLINERDIWLADQVNKRKGTYKAVKDDTGELRQDLREAKADYQELINKSIENGKNS